MQDYKGSCHCGAVRFSYTGEAITKGLRCNCSVCSRKGAMMSTELIPEADLNINADEAVLGLYQFGAKTAKHFFCKNCGIYTFHETARRLGTIGSIWVASKGLISSPLSTRCLMGSICCDRLIGTTKR